jgi:hypothetical protein
MLEVLACAVHLVAQERATGATFLPFGTKHEMIDDELATAVEQRRQRYWPVLARKDILLLDLHPRQGATHF